MDRNDSSDAEEILNVYLHSYDGPQIQLWACYVAKRAGTGQNNSQRRQIELMCEVNRACVLVRDQC